MRTDASPGPRRMRTSGRRAESTEDSRHAGVLPILLLSALREAPMFRHVIWLALLLSQANGQVKSTAERLGYPANTKLLIIHADDLAVSHSQDRASFAALD